MVLTGGLALLLERSVWVQESWCLFQLQIKSDWRPIVKELARMKSRRGIHHFYSVMAERASADGTFHPGMNRRDIDLVEACGIALADIQAEVGKEEFEKLGLSLLDDPAISEKERIIIRDGLKNP